MTKSLWKAIGFLPAAMLANAQSGTRPAVPVEPIAAIVAAFRSHSIVALGNVEGGNEQSAAFRLSLIRDPRFAALANDILVEFGSARFQGVVDRFVRGEDVPEESLRRVWRDTTQVEYEWDLPIYEEFFRAVRAVNKSLPAGRQLRILLGDPPMDWEKVHNSQELIEGMGDRDGHAVEVLRREVLEKGRRALVIYGGQHLLRKNTVPGAADESARGVVARLERDHATRTFTILPETRRSLSAIEAQVASWPIPSLAILSGTILGASILEPGSQRRPVRMEEQFDAVLYLGPPSSMTRSKPSAALCSDRVYMDMRLGRLNLIPPPPGARFSPAEQLKDDCAHPNGYREIADREPAITELVRRILTEAAKGKVSAKGIAEESRGRLVPFLERDGPRFLGPAGEIQSLVLLEDSESGGRRSRRYRSVFASGLRMIWAVGLSPSGEIVSFDPRPE